jgi:dihydrofolate reductase
MSNVVLYIAISLDGYIADADGGVGWLDAFDLEGEDYGYHAMYSRMGALVMGGETYRFVEGVGGWPYPGVKTYVLTRGELHAPEEYNLEAYQGDVAALIERIQLETDQDIWLVGGAQANALFAEIDRIDEYIVSVMPVVLGKGIPLFTGFTGPHSLTLTDVQSFSNGVVQMRYLRERKS